MARLFIGIDFPEELKASITQIIPNEKGFKKPLSSQIHLTLRFIGNVTECSQQNIIQNLNAHSTSSCFPLIIRGAGCFILKKIPQVLWISTEPCPALEILKNKIDDALWPLGFKKENREFVPHITIARLKDISAEKIRAWLEKYKDFYCPTTMINKFYLFSSQLSPEGAIYTKEAEFLLRTN